MSNEEPTANEKVRQAPRINYFNDNERFFHSR